MEKLRNQDQHSGRGRRVDRITRHTNRANQENADLVAGFNGTKASVKFLGSLMFGVNLDKPETTHTIEIKLTEAKTPRELYARLLKAIE